MGHQIAGDIHAVDGEIPVLDADVHVHPEDEQALSHIAQLLDGAHVALFGRHHLFLPVGEGMRARRSNRQALLFSQIDDCAPLFGQFVMQLVQILADLGAQLHLRLQQLRFHLPVDDLALFVQQLGDVGFQLPGFGIDDLIFFLDADGERWLFDGHTDLLAIVFIERRMNGDASIVPQKTLK